MQKLLMMSVITMVGVTSAFADVTIPLPAQVTLEARCSAYSDSVTHAQLTTDVRCANGPAIFDSDYRLAYPYKDNYSRATYSFYYGTQEREKNYNDVDIEFSSIAGVDSIHLNTVTHDLSMIADLGKMSCKDIKSDDENLQGSGGAPTVKDRINNPMLWFKSSRAMSALQSGPIATEMKVQTGHCYVLTKSTIDREVVAVFHVDQLIPNKSLIINEMEVFYRGKISEDMSVL